MTKVPVGVLISGSGTNLQALIDACERPDYPAEIAVVISNKKSAYGLERAKAAGLATAWLPARPHPSREAHEAALTETLRRHAAQWVVCAGYMRVLSPSFVHDWPNRILNIHPALLPAFPGIDAQGQAHEAGVRISGATVHLVDEGCDTGPILAQAATAVLEDDTRDSLQKRILKLEHVLYPQVLRWAVEGRIELHGGRASIRLAPGESRFLWLSPE